MNIELAKEMIIIVYVRLAYQFRLEVCVCDNGTGE
jgi:hypothetical protein